MSVSDHHGLIKLNNQELIDRFNNDVGNPGWVRARGEFHLAMFEEFEKRGIDYSVIGNEISVSWAKWIRLIGNTIYLEEQPN